MVTFIACYHANLIRRVGISRSRCCQRTTRLIHVGKTARSGSANCGSSATILLTHAPLRRAQSHCNPTTRRSGRPGCPTHHTGIRRQIQHSPPLLIPGGRSLTTAARRPHACRPRSCPRRSPRRRWRPRHSSCCRKRVPSRRRPMRYSLGNCPSRQIGRICGPVAGLPSRRARERWPCQCSPCAIPAAGRTGGC